jgi:hypothetical protein
MIYIYLIYSTLIIIIVVNRRLQLLDSIPSIRDRTNFFNLSNEEYRNIIRDFRHHIVLGKIFRCNLPSLIQRAMEEGVGKYTRQY